MERSLSDQTICMHSWDFYAHRVHCSARKRALAELSKLLNHLWAILWTYVVHHLYIIPKIDIVMQCNGSMMQWIQVFMHIFILAASHNHIKSSVTSMLYDCVPSSLGFLTFSMSVGNRAWEKGYYTAHVSVHIIPLLYHPAILLDC